MISTVLVANRGEVARRVIRAAHGLGMRAVAVYSDADRGAAHVREADAAVRIGPAAAAASYLDIEALLAAAHIMGADAIHPGYGFLSERAAFARAVTAAGLTFVGPSADVIDLMGRKDAARRVAVAAGVQVVPDVDLDHPTFPLLVKAAAGGGGKGMRIVADAAALAPAMAAARREAVAAFGDDTLLVEHYLPDGRHVEVQVLGDHHGTVVHLFERDCSVQRRHQKVVEESPAPTISAEVRAVLLGSALALAKQVGYTNAGTVEFLVRGDEVYFLEMNTRLQVEHPVTELVTGLDLVELQLLVAAGQRLPLTQSDVRLSGHAIEARVYAEDAFGGFLPQAGTAESVRWPSRARVDASLSSGDVVGTTYDPMLGKIITHGPTREAARLALVDALDDTAIIGLTSNVGFLRSLVASTAFRAAEVHTAWLDARPGAVQPPDATFPALVAAWSLAGAASDPGDPFGRSDGWRLAGPPAVVPVELVVDGERSTFGVDRAGGWVTAGERSWHVAGLPPDGDVLRLQIDGVVHQAVVRVRRDRVDVAHRGHTVSFERPGVLGPRSSAAEAGGAVVAPMPGTLLSVSAAPGDQVEAGDVLGVMEAMKMEVTLRAPVTGTVRAVAVVAGDRVPLGAPLFVVEAAP